MPTKQGARQRLEAWLLSIRLDPDEHDDIHQILDALEAEARDKEDAAFLRELNRLSGQGYLKAWLRRRRERRRK